MSIADGLVAGPALIGFSILDAQQIAVDEDLRMTETDVKHFVGNQKIVFAGIAFGPLPELHTAPPVLSSFAARTSLATHTLPHSDTGITSPKSNCVFSIDRSSKFILKIPPHYLAEPYSGLT